MHKIRQSIASRHPRGHPRLRIDPDHSTTAPTERMSPHEGEPAQGEPPWKGSAGLKKEAKGTTRWLAKPHGSGRAVGAARSCARFHRDNVTHLRADERFLGRRARPKRFGRLQPYFATSARKAATRSTPRRHRHCWATRGRIHRPQDTRSSSGCDRPAVQARDLPYGGHCAWSRRA